MSTIGLEDHYNNDENGVIIMNFFSLCAHLSFLIYGHASDFMNSVPHYSHCLHAVSSNRYSINCFECSFAHFAGVSVGYYYHIRITEVSKT